MDKTKPTILFIIGPTASGKTALSLDVAEHMNCEIISADSIQVYRKLDIGSAKPSLIETKRVKHYMIDETDIDDRGFTVAEYAHRALNYADLITNSGKTPLVVGGTGLYVNSLTYPLNFSSAKPDFELREKLASEELESPGILHKKLSEIDSITAQRLHPNDTKRLVRALEVYYTTGCTMSDHGNDFINAKNAECACVPIMAGLTMPRKVLYERINLRVDDMLSHGLLAEVESIVKQGYDRTLPALQGLGYKQLIAYLNGECSYDAAVEEIKRDTRRFAKRQITWFKRDERIRWFDVSQVFGQALTDEVVKYFSQGMGDKTI